MKPIKMLDQFENTPNGLLVRAPAKINLSLLIRGKRPDGFHGIETLMAKINWYDELLFEPAQTNGIDLICTGPHWAPDGEENLVYRACKMLYERAGKTPAVRVTLTKNIPAGTGLGSASSDAAAALMGLNQFANLNQPDSVLNEICASLGSDINFFLAGPLAYCTGRGEKIEQIYKKCDFSAILLMPNISVLTKDVYGNYTHNKQTYNGLSEKINPLLQKKSVDSVAKICANMLAESCFGLYPQLERIKQDCERFCDSKVCLSGSGSAMYMLIPEPLEKFLQVRDYVTKKYNCESRVIYNNRW
ncbi:MAG: 4-(cytidine 5'-diphospho)-2-C-methyl-D-erythritol kinase [Planctomycetales bacterium 4572_13]|nr:MAG: 4-(cytidine 5'-diphospho)-2-C-methyl-D-erythritol kinase [Planctomycetales bacterium 4572_13]